MKSGPVSLQQTKSEPVVGKDQKCRASVATDARRPLMLCDAHSPLLRLGNGFGPSPILVSRGLQKKLTINEPGDQYEQEADRVAEQVMRMPDTGRRLPRGSGNGGTPASASCASCASPAVQLQGSVTAEKSSSAALAPPAVHEVLRSPGRPLDTATRAFMEPRFGQDFNQVRVHTDAQAAASAREIGALAFTVGPDIVFGSQYAPATVPGQRLLAHELAHVVQQRGQVMLRVQRLPIHMESGRFVGQIGGAENNNRDEVMEAMDRLAQINAYSSGTVYQSERTAVALLPAAGPVAPATIPATISAISTNETPELDTASAQFIGLTLTGTVGRGMINASDDILLLQDMLHVNWHITNLDYATERAVIPTTSTTNIPDGSIPKTIEGITKLRRAYVGGLHTLRFRRQLGVLGSALSEVGRLNWVPFNTGAAVANPAGLQSDFARWALIPGEPQPNSVSGRVNCWEMILLSAFIAGFLTLTRIRQIYSLAVANVRAGRAALVGDTVESELKTGRRVNILDLGNAQSPQPLAGDMVIFNTAANHAAISLGTLNSAGEHEVLSLFNRPNAISQVQRTTIEALIAANPTQVSTPIRFWGVNW